MNGISQRDYIFLLHTCKWKFCYVYVCLSVYVCMSLCVCLYMFLHIMSVLGVAVVFCRRARRVTEVNRVQGVATVPVLRASEGKEEKWVSQVHQDLWVLLVTLAFQERLDSLGFQ